jgi:uracil-DNA glycosylase
VTSYTWGEFIREQKLHKYFQDLEQFVNYAYATKQVYPAKADIFQAYKLCPIDQVKVVIVSQDPYYTPGVSHGLAFSTKNPKIPPSLMNIFSAIEYDLDIKPELSGDLTRWAIQGVFLINSVLTVEDGKPLSHANRGWEKFVSRSLKLINNGRPVVFLLWGAKAQSLVLPLLDNNKHYTLQTSHPSPLSCYRGFLTCKHFSLTNTILTKLGYETINWI